MLNYLYYDMDGFIVFYNHTQWSSHLHSLETKSLFIVYS